MSHFNLRARLYVLALITLLCAACASVWAQGTKHDKHDMPGMDMSQPKPTPTPQKKKAKPKKDEMEGMDMKGMPMPSPSPTPMPSPSPTPSPSPSTQPMERMPGMQMPQSSPSPTPMPAPEKMEMPMPAASPTPSAVPPPQNTGQSGMDNMQMNAPTGNDKSSGAGDAMQGMNMSAVGSHDLMVMSGNNMSLRLGRSSTNFLPMGVMGSGTAWQPASTPMHMWHKQSGEWLLMFHGELKTGINSQGGPRGVTKFESVNWFMPMAFRRVGPGTLQLRAMFSFEPFTFPPGGSPLLFQTGETYKGQPLIDKQHPHDLFMELSANYTVPLGERAMWFAYFGYPGEPALGPNAFMHRWSASENPSAPLSHHLQDSTHISFGVFTTGFTYRWFKLEGSIFNGREPDENRYNFEAHKWNSRSARLSFAPNENWSMQVSYGFLRSPEALELGGTTRRTTASVSYNKPLTRGNWATSLVWGRNHERHAGGDLFNLNGYLAESTVNFLDKNYLYTRLELVDKNQLLRSEDLTRLGFGPDAHPNFRIGAYTFGAARDLWNTDDFSVAVGGDLTFYSKPAALDPIYGSHPTSYKIFLRIRPGRMKMQGHMHQHDNTSEMDQQP